MTLVRVNDKGSNFLEWLGSDIGSNLSENVGTPVPIDFGFSSTKGTRIMIVDFSNLVQLYVNSAQSLMLLNQRHVPVTVIVTMMY